MILHILYPLEYLSAHWQNECERKQHHSIMKVVWPHISPGVLGWHLGELLNYSALWNHWVRWTELKKSEVFSYSIFCNVSQPDLCLQGTHGLIGKTDMWMHSSRWEWWILCIVCLCMERSRQTTLHIDDPSVEF